MWALVFLYLFLFTAFLSLLFTRIIISLSRKAGIVDNPGHRKIHKEPVPLLGGLGIYLAFTAAVLIHFRLAGIIAANPLAFPFVPAEIVDMLPGVWHVWEKLRVILMGATVMVLLGLLDDIWDVNAKIKLAVQILAAFVIVGFGIRITLFIDNYFIGAFITILWIVGITNAFNLLDNMDGLSSGVAFIASGLFFTASLLHGHIFVAVILAVFAGSVIGFLRYNFNPAKIFMGDAGSLFIGYVLSSLTILNSYYVGESPTHFPVIMPVLILAVPVYDTLSVVFIRIKNRESIFKPDRRHFSHRLVNLGFSQKQAVLLVYLVCLGVGIGSLLLRQVDLFGVAIIIIQLFAVFGVIIALEVAGARKSGEGE